MSVTLSDLTQAFDALGWRYQTVPDHDLLLTSFRTEGGSADLVLRPVAEGQAVLLEAMGLGSQPRERAEMLLALAWRWTGVAIARDPEDGEVRLRLILPVGEASLATAPLRAAVGMLLAAVDAFRQAVAQEDVEDVGAQRAVPDTVEAQRAASDALPAAAQRAMALLEALSQAPDQAAFLREHLDEFDGEVLAALAAMAQAAQEADEAEFAQGVAAVVAAVLALRRERDPQAQQERLQRLWATEDEAGLAQVVEEWPEALGPDVQQLLQGLAEAARKAGQEEMATRAEKACAHLQSLRAARPLDAALADFLDADTWEAGRAVVEANPLLQTQEAVARLGALAEAAQARGEEGANQRYRAHQRHLAQWLSELGVLTPIPPTSAWPKWARVHLARRQDDTSLNRAIEEAEAHGEREVADLLRAWREDDMKRVQRLGEELEAQFWQEQRGEEALTVALLKIELKARLVEAFNYFPLPQQELVLEVGLQACDQAIELSRRLSDEPCTALYLGAKGNGLYRARRLGEAEGLYREAERLDPQNLSGAGWRALVNLGYLYRAQGLADQAYQSWSKALNALEVWRGSLSLLADRLSLQVEYADVYADMASFCLEQGWPERAWHWAERGKGRTLADLLAGARPRLDTPEKQELYARWHALHLEVLALEARLDALRRGTNGHGTVRSATEAAPALDPQARSQEIAALEDKLQAKRPQEAALWQQILGWMHLGRERVPEAPALARALQTLTLPLSPSAATGEGPGMGATSLPPLHAGEEGGPGGMVGAHPLLAEFLLTGQDRYRVFLLPLWQVTPDGPLPIRVTEEFPIPQAEEGIPRVMITFLAALTAARLGFAGRYRGQVPEEAAGLSLQEQDQARREAFGLFNELAAQVGQAFLQPWEETLAEFNPTELVLVGDRFLHLLPLHAGLLRDDQPLIERYAICYLPNAHIADRLLRQREDPVPFKPLIMGPPEPQGLPGARAETEELARLWGVPRYAGDQMRIQVLREHAGQIGLAHLATHSMFDWERYLESRIMFHEEWLTVARLLSDETLDFRGTRLFYLGSCESGLSALGAGGDELQGLVWALFLAGARSVMATLWPVHDLAAYHMSQRFYFHRVKRRLPLIQAYAWAVRDLRNPNYVGDQARSPYFWAPFVLFGDGWVD